MSDEKKDLRPGRFPDELKWTQDEAIKSLDKIHQFVIDECDRCINWYFAKKYLTRILGYGFRSGAIFILGISAIIPVLSEIYKTDSVPAISPLWATVAVVIAGVLVSCDRFGGWTSSWIRFVQTAQALSQLRSNFQIEWEKHKVKLNDGKTESAVLEEGVEKCREFLETVHSQVVAETNQWAQEFQKALVEIDGKNKPKGSSRNNTCNW